MSATIKRTTPRRAGTAIEALKVGAFFQTAARDTDESHKVFIRVRDGAIALGEAEMRTLLGWDDVEEIDVEIVVKE